VSISRHDPSKGHSTLLPSVWNLWIQKICHLHQEWIPGCDREESCYESEGYLDSKQEGRERDTVSPSLLCLELICVSLFLKSMMVKQIDSKGMFFCRFLTIVCLVCFICSKSCWLQHLRCWVRDEVVVSSFFLYRLLKHKEAPDAVVYPFSANQLTNQSITILTIIINIISWVIFPGEYGRRFSAKI